MNKQEALEKIKELEAYIENLDKQTYSIGDRFSLDGEEYILCCVAHKEINLICLEDGSRWDNPVKVNNARSIKRNEFKQLTGDFNFKKITL